MVTPEQNWDLGEWMLKRYAERQYRELKNKRRAESGIVYGRDDYDIRKKGDHYESYNVHTGESLYEALTYEEASADLRETFGS